MHAPQALKRAHSSKRGEKEFKEPSKMDAGNFEEKELLLPHQ